MDVLSASTRPLTVLEAVEVEVDVVALEVATVVEEAAVTAVVVSLQDSTDYHLANFYQATAAVAVAVAVAVVVRIYTRT